MIFEYLIAFCLGSLGGILFSWALRWSFRRRLYSLEVDVADLQERHLRSVRKAASKERWDQDDLLDEKIVGALAVKPKSERWTKWPSSAPSENSSGT